MPFNNKTTQIIALIKLPYVIKAIKHLVFVEIVEKFNCCDLYDVLSKTYFILPKSYGKLAKLEKYKHNKSQQFIQHLGRKSLRCCVLSV